MVIIMNLLSIFEYNYLKNYVINKIKINKTLLIQGIFECIINKLINCSLTFKDIDTLYKYFIKKVYNKENRHFERISKTPFSKWNIKSYSINSENIKIINSFLNNNLNNLNKNQKCKINKIEKIIKQ
jgi:hypothetical protein